MLSNAYFVAKFRFDTAENELAKNLQNLIFEKCIFEKCIAALSPSGTAVRRPRSTPAGTRARRPPSRRRAASPRTTSTSTGATRSPRLSRGLPCAAAPGADGEVQQGRPRRCGGAGAARASVGKISAKCCSISAVSAPIFASRIFWFQLFLLWQP